MNYRRVYMLIIKHAKNEMELGLRKKGNGNYYENHHILPKSLFPLWSKRESNLVLLTAREHFFCHQLLTKIYPCREMIFAMSCFLRGLNKDSGRGVRRKNEYKITSREYERIRNLVSNEMSKLKKEKWSNMTKEEKDVIIERLRKANMDPEIKESRNKKYRETLSKRTEEEWNKIKEKSNKTKQNRTEEEKIAISERLSKNTKGKKWYNNGIVQVLSFDCPEGFTKGQIPNPEARKKSGETNRERNKTRGSTVSRMTEEEYLSWKKKLSEGHKKTAKLAYENMPEEAKIARAEKISKSLKGRKHTKEFCKKVSEGIMNSPKHKEAVRKRAELQRGKKFFNNGKICKLAETCPEGFVPGMLKRKKNKETECL